MNYKSGEYDITFADREGRLVTYSFDREMKNIYIELPEVLNHPAFYPFFSEEVQKMLARQEMFDNNVSHVVKARSWDKPNQSASKVATRLIRKYGDMGTYKDCWDYNKSPPKTTKEGRFADLMGFIEMRKGSKLEMTK